MKNIADIRTDYKLGSLNEDDVAKDPFVQFDKWWKEVLNSDIEEPNAMIISTVNDNAVPSSRTVLLKGFNTEGFIFYTNYNSHKAADINENASVAVLFFWKELQRQVRISGKAEKTSSEISDEYFASRPRGSKIAAWSSDQSSIVENRTALEQSVKEYKEKFHNQEVPRPPHWGGYIIKPTAIEFWQGRTNRMHDRIEYTQTQDGWKISRLAP